MNWDSLSMFSYGFQRGKHDNVKQNSCGKEMLRSSHDIEGEGKDEEEVNPSSWGRPCQDVIICAFESKIVFWQWWQPPFWIFGSITHATFSGIPSSDWNSGISLAKMQGLWSCISLPGCIRQAGKGSRVTIHQKTPGGITYSEFQMNFNTPLHLNFIRIQIQMWTYLALQLGATNLGQHTKRWKCKSSPTSGAASSYVS